GGSSGGGGAIGSAIGELGSAGQYGGGPAWRIPVLSSPSRAPTPRVWGIRSATSSPFCRRAECYQVCVLRSGPFKIACSGSGGDIGDVSIPARVVGCPQSFRNRLG